MNQQSQQKDDSVLFSLRSLMAIEDDRLRQEDTARQQAVAMEQARADDARRREESEVAAQKRAEVDARLADERQRREAEAQAVREREESALRIRLEAESRRQERELSLRLEQEQRLATIALQQRRGVHPGALGLGALALMAAMGAGTFFGVVKPMREAGAAATQRAELARRDADERRVVAERSADVARRQVADAEAAGRRATAEAQLAAHNAARVTTPSAERPVVGSSTPRRSRVVRPPVAEPEIIGDIDGELPGADRH